jgi:hypothetical protein
MMIALILTLNFLFSLPEEKKEILKPIVSKECFKESFHKKMRAKALIHLEKQDKASFILFLKLAKAFANKENQEMLNLEIHDIFINKITKNLCLNFISFYVESFKKNEEKLQTFFIYMLKTCENTWIQKKAFKNGQEFIDELTSYCHIMGKDSYKTMRDLIERIFISFYKGNDTQGLINIYPFCINFGLDIPISEIKKEIPNHIEDAKYFIKKNNSKKASETLQWALIIDPKNTNALTLLNSIKKN